MSRFISLITEPILLAIPHPHWPYKFDVEEKAVGIFFQDHNFFNLASKSCIEMDPMAQIAQHVGVRKHDLRGTKMIINKQLSCIQIQKIQNPLMQNTETKNEGYVPFSLLRNRLIGQSKEYLVIKIHRHLSFPIRNQVNHQTNSKQRVW